MSIEYLSESTGMSEGILASSLGMSVECFQKSKRILRLFQVVDFLYRLDEDLTSEEIHQILNTDVKVVDVEEPYSLITSINLGLTLSCVTAYEEWKKTKGKQ